MRVCWGSGRFRGNCGKASRLRKEGKPVAFVSQRTTRIDLLITAGVERLCKSRTIFVSVTGLMRYQAARNQFRKSPGSDFPLTTHHDHPHRNHPGPRRHHRPVCFDGGGCRRLRLGHFKIKSQRLLAKQQCPEQHHRHRDADLGAVHRCLADMRSRPGDYRDHITGDRPLAATLRRGETTDGDHSSKAIGPDDLDDQGPRVVRP